MGQMAHFWGNRGLLLSAAFDGEPAHLESQLELAIEPGTLRILLA